MKWISNTDWLHIAFDNWQLTVVLHKTKETLFFSFLILILDFTKSTCLGFIFGNFISLLPFSWFRLLISVDGCLQINTVIFFIRHGCIVAPLAHMTFDHVLFYLISWFTLVVLCTQNVITHLNIDIITGILCFPFDICNWYNKQKLWKIHYIYCISYSIAEYSGVWINNPTFIALLSSEQLELSPVVGEVSDIQSVVFFM